MKKSSLWDQENSKNREKNKILKNEKTSKIDVCSDTDRSNFMSWKWIYILNLSNSDKSKSAIRIALAQIIKKFSHKLLKIE